jgi:hypothetical protein
MNVVAIDGSSYQNITIEQMHLIVFQRHRSNGSTTTALMPSSDI